MKLFYDAKKKQKKNQISKNKSKKLKLTDMLLLRQNKIE